MKKYIEIRNEDSEIIEYIEIEEKDVELAKQRMEALVKRWDENEMEMSNNDYPIYTRDTYFNTLLDMYLSKDYLVAGLKIEYKEYAPRYFRDKEIDVVANVVASYEFEDLTEDCW